MLFSFEQSKYPDLAKELKRRMSGQLPEGWKDNLPKFTPAVRTVPRASARVRRLPTPKCHCVSSSNGRYNPQPDRVLVLRLLFVPFSSEYRLSCPVRYPAAGAGVGVALLLTWYIR